MTTFHHFVINLTRISSSSSSSTGDDLLNYYIIYFINYLDKEPELLQIELRVDRLRHENWDDSRGH